MIGSLQFYVRFGNESTGKYSDKSLSIEAILKQLYKRTLSP